MTTNCCYSIDRFEKKWSALAAILCVLLLTVGCSDDRTDGSSDEDGNGDADTDTDTDTDGTGDSDPGGGTDTSSFPNGSDQCADVNWSVDVRVIHMLVLLDRSASMYNYEIGEDTYAQVVQEAIESVVESNINAGVINFALNVFPSAAECTDAYRQLPLGERDPMVLCQAASRFSSDSPSVYDPPVVTFAPDVTVDTYLAIRQALGDVGQCGGTPVCESLRWTKQYLNDEQMPPGDTYVLLATDGAPNCNPGLTLPCVSAVGGQDASHPMQCLDDICSYEAAMDLALAGYRLFVIGVGDEVDSFAEVMDGLAWFGSATTLLDVTEPVPPSDEPRYFPADDAATINAAFEQVTNLVINCEYTVHWATVPDTMEPTGQPVEKRCDSVNLTATHTNGQRVRLYYSGVEEEGKDHCEDESEDNPGWYWVELTGEPFSVVEAQGEDVGACSRIQLCPMACAKLKSDDGVREWTAVSAEFGCQSAIMPPLD